MRQTADATVKTSSTTQPGGHFSVEATVNIPTGYIPVGIGRITYVDYGVTLAGYNISSVTESSLTMKVYFENVSGSTLQADRAVNVRVYFAKIII